MSKQEVVSLEKFYASVAHKSLTDDQALEYMHFAAKLAQLEFKDEEEMLTAKDEFVSALAFIDKLEEVDVKGVEPLGNVLEFYGGNDDLVRSEEDFALMAKEENLEFQKEAKKLNKHMVANYVVLNTPTKFNPDNE